MLRGQIRDVPVTVLPAPRPIDGLKTLPEGLYMLKPRQAALRARLTSALCAANVRGAVLRGQIRDVPVTVLPAPRPIDRPQTLAEGLSEERPEGLPPEQAAAIGYGLDAASGLVNVPADAAPDAVYSWLEVSLIAAALSAG